MSKVYIGNDFWASRDNKTIPVYWDPSLISNHHIGVAGTSGAGKTHWIRQFINGMPNDVEIDIFDYHGDIEIDKPDCKSVLFSEATMYGYNPLILNTDQHYGGVRRAVNYVIESINSTSRRLGGNQEGVLRHLLTDTYMLKGIFADNPKSWSKREASEKEIRELYEQRNWNELRNIYPTLNDAITYGRRKLKALWMGFEDKDNGKKALSAFDDYCKVMSNLNSTRTKLSKSGNTEDIEKLQTKLDTVKAKALDSFTTFLEKMETGREFDEVIKYNSTDVLLSVITRLENLAATGIFNPNPPPFGNSRIRRYILKPLAQSEDELKMFVRFRLRSIINEMMQKGESKTLKRLIVVDESKKFNDEDPSNPINIIVNEMRKFGLAILLAGQSPAHFSNDFIKNAGTLLLLNLSTSDWNDAARSLKIDQKELKYLKPRETGAIRMLEAGQSASFKQIKFT